MIGQTQTGVMERVSPAPARERAGEQLETVTLLRTLVLVSVF